jgi:PadR family transcriptional regulator, regulatory protein AphA
MKIGVLGHLLLGLLSDGERTGYELTRDFDTSLANVWGASLSQIYPELAKLESEGLIRKTESGPRGSQPYAITAAGRAEVEVWLSETSPADSPRSERMARVFFLGMLPKARAAGYLADQERAHRAKLAQYLAIAEMFPPGAEATHWDRIALEAGIRSETAMAEWAAWAIEALGEDNRQ